MATADRRPSAGILTITRNSRRPWPAFRARRGFTSRPTRSHRRCWRGRRIGFGRRDAIRQPPIDIQKRHWLLIDVDPVRPAGISASETEHAAALLHAGEIRDVLHAEGWPSPI